MTDYSLIDVTPLASAFGAEIRGLSIADGVSDARLEEVRRAFLAHQVLFFKDQPEIPPARHVEFARRFGDLHTHPAAPGMAGHPEIFEIHTHRDSKIANGEFWHSDVSCDAEPPLGTMLQLHILPPKGGDTLFSDMYRAYEALPASCRARVDGMMAVHESAHVIRGATLIAVRSDDGIECPSAVHPVVRTHPDTGRKALYVNRTFTTRISGLSRDEADELLAYLFDHSEQQRFQLRFRWSRNDMAFWDNRCCMHYAVWDYGRRNARAGA